MFRDHGPDTVSARALGLALSMYADSESGTAWPTQERLATDIASSQTTVTKYIGELEEAGWIERDRSGRRRIYRLTIPDDLDAEHCRETAV
ncbi:MAG: helix-turn-helix domain-containing protein, partial [Bradymonadaceae bacterium]